MHIVTIKQKLKRLGPQEKLVFIFSFIAIFTACFMAVILAVTGQEPFAIRLAAFGLLYTLPVLVQYYQRSLRHSMMAILTLTTVAIALVVGFKDGMYDAGWYWLTILPITGGLLARRFGVLFGSGCQWTLLLLNVYLDLIAGYGAGLPDDYTFKVSGALVFQALVPMVVWQFLIINTWELESKTKKVDTLLKIVTHDIANPLTVIHGMSEAILTFKTIDPKVAGVLRKIHKSSSDIREILIRVKNLQAMKSAKLKVEVSNVSLRAVLDQVETTFESKLRAKGISYRLDFGAHEDLQVLAEPTTLRNDVFNNLISNAIKFSKPDSEILVEVSIDHEKIHVKVCDSGIGMSKELQKDVFDEFKETSRLGTDGEEGTGFGLPIVKYLVAAYGGYIQVESRAIEQFPESHGTTFHVFLEKASSDPATHTIDSARKIA
ncbi:sensor histidine kinase [Pseudobacteriovorax antillogorgiicola]|uniref:histidine kinase n=1 Tax=Pseudobacteriovorax antillogorgiicola TaxID=1513793 RepID=A0A1Y6CUZ6_9BACT|nr:HAMP domain-containing sensor histidine kinase [Pseudobacteriovorax antillogorgiicola]TCS44980.1 histidine kinase/DNA gyrase B/HSP90-like ATPase [Pseudobacteriovorax antillogorgiicola]SMF76721.1 Histidine kinase-, DNA gyrase B-, and HSP90-like ATPase [Pseudobacteriovorax antillogorgiicola]